MCVASIARCATWGTRARSATVAPDHPWSARNLCGHPGQPGRERGLREASRTTAQTGLVPVAPGQPADRLGDRLRLRPLEEHPVRAVLDGVQKAPECEGGRRPAERRSL